MKTALILLLIAIVYFSIRIYIGKKKGNFIGKNVRKTDHLDETQNKTSRAWRDVHNNPDNFGGW